MLLALHLLVAAYAPPVDRTFDGTDLTPSKIAIVGENLWIIRPGVKPLQIAKPKYQWMMELTWSPDGKRLAYVFPLTDIGPDHLWIINEDGSDKKQLTFKEGRARDIHWMQDSQSILFSRFDGSRDYVGTFTVNSEDLQTTRKREVGLYQVSPDRKFIAVDRLAFDGDKPKGDGLWLYDTNLKPMKKLLSERYGDKVRWINSRTIWYSVFVPDTNRLKHFLIDVNTRKSKLVATTEYLTYGSISPDSRFLVHPKYVKEDHYQLEATNLKTKKTRILDQNASKAEVMWTADSKWVYYQKTDPKEKDGDGGGSLWAVNRDSLKRIRLGSNRLRYTHYQFDQDHHFLCYLTGSQIVMVVSPFKVVKVAIPEAPDGIALFWGK